MGYIYTGIAILLLALSAHLWMVPEFPIETATEVLLAGVLANNVAVDTTVETANNGTNISSPGIVWVSDTNGFIFYEDSGGGLSMSSTTDSGATWSAARTMDSVNTTDVVSYAVWWEGWTPGTTTTRFIHIVTTDLGVDDTYYTRFDTTTGGKTATVLGTTQGAACSEAVSCYTSITMSATGTLMMTSAAAADVWVVRCGNYLSCSTASNWHEVAGGYYSAPERGPDWPLLLPTPGNDNILFVFFNESANQLNWNMYSATSSSWWRTSTTTIVSSIDDTDTYDSQHLGGVISTTTGNIYVTIVDDANNFTVADHDILIYEYSTTTNTWSAVTNPVTDSSGGLTAAKMAYDARNDILYSIYGKRTTIGTPTTGGIYYKTSTDGGSTWSSESAMVNDNADDINGLTTNIISYDRIGVTWNYTTAPRADQQFYDDIVDLYEVVAEASRRAQAEIWFD